MRNGRGGCGRSVGGGGSGAREQGKAAAGWAIMCQNCSLWLPFGGGDDHPHLVSSEATLGQIFGLGHGRL